MGEGASEHPDEPAPAREMDLEHERRIAALRGLARQQQPEQAPVGVRLTKARGAGGAPPRRPARRFWIATVGGVAAICMLVSAVLLGQRTPPPSAVQPRPTATVATADPLVLKYARMVPGCPVQAGWSPDGQRFAVGGFTSCGDQYGLPNISRPLQTGAVNDSMLAIYDMGSGRLRTQVQFGMAIMQQALPQDTQNNQTLVDQYVVAFTRLIWSPDGHRIAVEFSVIPQQAQQAQPPPTSQGLLVWEDTGQTRVFLLPPQLIHSADAQSVYRWNVALGAVSREEMAAALDYYWDTGDMLMPADTLPASPSAPPPIVRVASVGDPDGGDSFFVWQQGAMERVCVPASTGNAASSSGSPGACDHLPVCAVPAHSGNTWSCCVPPDYVAATFGPPAAWSPDGQYLVLPAADTFGAAGRLTTPLDTLVQQPCATPSPVDGYRLLPPRDRGLVSAFSLVPYFPNAPVYVAWDPAGQRLAALSNASTEDTDAVTIFDTGGGGALVQLSVQQLEGVSGGDALPVLAPPLWSPDGKRLLILDSGKQVLAVLGPASLKE
jgi:hypothetical protein